MPDFSVRLLRVGNRNTAVLRTERGKLCLQAGEVFSTVIEGHFAVAVDENLPWHRTGSMKCRSHFIAVVVQVRPGHVLALEELGRRVRIVHYVNTQENDAVRG